MHLTHYYVGTDAEHAERVIRESIAQADETHVSMVREEFSDWDGTTVIVADPQGSLWNVVGWTRS